MFVYCSHLVHTISVCYTCILYQCLVLEHTKHMYAIRSHVRIFGKILNSFVVFFTFHIASSIQSKNQSANVSILCKFLFSFSTDTFERKGSFKYVYVQWQKCVILMLKKIENMGKHGIVYTRLINLQIMLSFLSRVNWDVNYIFMRKRILINMIMLVEDGK